MMRDRAQRTAQFSGMILLLVVLGARHRAVGGEAAAGKEPPKPAVRVLIAYDTLYGSTEKFAHASGVLKPVSEKVPSPCGSI